MSIWIHCLLRRYSSNSGELLWALQSALYLPRHAGRRERERERTQLTAARERQPGSEREEKTGRQEGIEREKTQKRETVNGKERERERAMLRVKEKRAIARAF